VEAYRIHEERTGGARPADGGRTRGEGPGAR
jgi:hypothetical protein